MIEFLEAIRDFTETGGQVLLVIGLLIFVMWLLILERAMYLMVWHKKAVRRIHGFGSESMVLAL